ncbi:hypothetical protein L6452_17731 [Arctium lappa]|uniref:Uncharacterized protein n=1 Tax=Arctium lappa TaxID=4217 RepID=A0ACB9C495_ARCLA|nr:hypothetical protein L6452_17731 [Arctium lappa]
MCCKSSCKVTDIKDLPACHFCFDKAFEKFNDMCNATWKRVEGTYCQAYTSITSTMKLLMDRGECCFLLVETGFRDNLAPSSLSRTDYRM